MIAVHDPEVAERLRRLRQHAMDVSDLARHAARDVVIEHYPERGWNYRMTDMQAAARPLPARGARRDPRRAAAAGRALHRRRSREVPFIEPPFEPDYAGSAPGSPTPCGSTREAPIDATS